MNVIRSIRQHRSITRDDSGVAVEVEFLGLVNDEGRNEDGHKNKRSLQLKPLPYYRQRNTALLCRLRPATVRKSCHLILGTHVLCRDDAGLTSTTR